MPFVPVPGLTVQVCAWETRVQDYAAFIQSSPTASSNGLYRVGATRSEFCADCSWRQPGFNQSPLHPVVGVSWDDAQSFCRWLTNWERRSGRLKLGQRYRLPTDQEWSKAAGLPSEPGSTPQERFLSIKELFPWGAEWPPPPGAANLAEALLVDPYPSTAPVGSFPPNDFGLYDLAGNVSEWCEDWWNRERKFRVLRGAAWNLDCSLCLMTSYRFPNYPGMRNDTYGFRVVLE